MAYRKVYFRIRTEGYVSGWSSDADRSAFKEESRRLFQELGWMISPGYNGSCDVVTKDRQDLYLHPTSFSGVMEETNIQPLQEQLLNTQAKEQLGQTTAEYITNLLTEYYEMKGNGGNAAMTNGKNRTLAFQIDEELFQQIKAHLDRESARLGRKVTQREFVLNAIIGALNMSKPMDVDEAGVAPCEPLADQDDTQHQAEE